MRENTEQNNSEYGRFLHSDWVLVSINVWVVALSCVNPVLSAALKLLSCKPEIYLRITKNKCIQKRFDSRKFSNGICFLMYNFRFLNFYVTQSYMLLFFEILEILNRVTTDRSLLKHPYISNLAVLLWNATLVFQILLCQIKNVSYCFTVKQLMVNHISLCQGILFLLAFQ